MRFFDTHCHLNFSDFDNDRDRVIAECKRENVFCLAVGTNYLSSKKAVEVSQGNSRVWAAIGLHPLNIKNIISKLKRETSFSKAEDVLEDDFSESLYKDLAYSEKVVAIGEIGLDYWSKPKTKAKESFFKQKQKEILRKQLEMAIALDLPVIFHCRVAHQDLIDFLTRDNLFKKLKGAVVHSFVGKWNEAKKYLEMGFSIGVNGIAFKLDLSEIIQKTPLERILVETDAPFLAPPGFGKERNTPLGTKEVVRLVADTKKESFEKVASVVFENALRFFDINA